MCNHQIYNLPDCLFALIDGGLTTKPSDVHHLQQFSANSLPPLGPISVTSSAQKDPRMMEIDSVTLKHVAQVSNSRVKDVSVVILKRF